MNYAADSDHHVRKTVRSLRRTLGLLTILAVEVTAVYALPPETCDLAATPIHGSPVYAFTYVNRREAKIFSPRDWLDLEASADLLA